MNIKERESMNLMELVKSRRSVRTFDGKAPDREEVRNLLKYADEAGNPYNLPITWKVMGAKKNGLKSPVISGTDAFIAGKMQKAPHAEEAFGYEFEDIVLYAQSKGFGTTWIAGTMDRPAFERAMELKDGEVMPCISPLGYPAKKMAIREGVMRKAVKADSRLTFEELFYANTFAEPLSKDTAGDFADALEIPDRPVILCGDVNDTGNAVTSRIISGEVPQQCHFAKAMEEENRRCEFVISDPGIEMPADTEYIASYHVGAGE